MKLSPARVRTLQGAGSGEQVQTTPHEGATCYVQLRGDSSEVSDGDHVPGALPLLLAPLPPLVWPLRCAGCAMAAETGLRTASAELNIGA